MCKSNTPDEDVLRISTFISKVSAAFTQSLTPHNPNIDENQDVPHGTYSRGNNKKRKTFPVPRMCDLSKIVKDVPFQAPPALVNQFKSTQRAFALDIEIHDIIHENTRAWLCGHYGFPARVLPSTMESLRVIQIAWAMGDIHLDTPTMYVF